MLRRLAQNMPAGEAKEKSGRRQVGPINHERRLATHDVQQ
jgi:hypothetical protein